MALKCSKRERMKAKTMVTKGLLLKMASEQRDLFLDALRCLIALST